MINVTLLAFSGRKNYEWDYGFDDENNHQNKGLLELFKLNKEGINSDLEKHFRKLGFSGFYVEFSGTTVDEAKQLGLPEYFYVCDGQVSGLAKSQLIGRELLKGFKEDNKLREYIELEIASIEPQKSIVSVNSIQLEEAYNEEKYIEKKDSLLRDVVNPRIKEVLFFDLNTGGRYKVDWHHIRDDKSFWNEYENGSRLKKTNCYAYACNYAIEGFPQPGGSGNFKAYKDNVIEGAIADGLIKIKDHNKKYMEKSPSCVVALYTTDDDVSYFDYHWYKFVQTGTEDNPWDRIWAHKPGNSKVRETDNKGRIIYDPCHSDRGVYKNFCGYFLVNRDVVIKQ
ncbi:hypothetical protein AB204_09320 [Xenorhabdus khoisanae]|uniref:Uncharacterized protein n=1 Tax=Xenorhabdus khoisanae TaxID=880157 RepID=A0A0J5FSW8_9GAMM|nr:hypothetical protein [Xenorhabdus khoisanae]KMJ45361.1 hypothetical protein AB204_09320 [Xenorhabdus khoisanae]